MAEFTGEYSLFIGRWQVPDRLHDGHIKLIKTVLDEGGKVCIGIRDTKIDEKNPYSVRERIKVIRNTFPKEIKSGTVKYVKLPDILNVCYGRDKGWGVRQIKLDTNTESISATEIRKRSKNV